MNPLTLVKRIQKINSTEAALGISEEASWHARYKDSAYVYIGGLPFDLTEGDLLAVFAQYGEVVDVNLVRDKGTGKSRGFAFLAYEDQRSTILAVDNLNGAKLLGRIIRVDHVSNYKKKEEEEDEEKEMQKREARGVCRAFQRGECNRGAGCKFSHDEQRSANTGWGAQDSNVRWGRDMHEDPLKSRRRSTTHIAPSQTLERNVKEGELKSGGADRDDGHSSKAEGEDGHGRTPHPPKEYREEIWKDGDRRGREDLSEKYRKEIKPREDLERRMSEKLFRTDREDERDRQGSEKRLRRGDGDSSSSSSSQRGGR